MIRSRLYPFSPPVVALLLLAVVPPVRAQQLPPGITWEQLNQLPAQQRAELLRRLQQMGLNVLTTETGETRLQLPESMIPLPDTSRGITRVDTTQYFIENPFDFGLVEGEFDSTRVLELFGRRIFQLAVDGFEPSTYGPVGPDYLLGPGDEVIISITGSYQRVHDLTINREGFVLIPDAGQVVLAYLTLEQARERLYQFLTPSQQALNWGRPGATAFLDISLGKLRAIKIFILGEAVRPGSYTLSSVSTAFHALYAAGGPTAQGSLRNIGILRRSREVARLDAYDYLLRGMTSDDIRLEDGDIVYISPIGPQVMVQGRVRRPAVYEIKTGETLRDVITAAGGITASALLDRAQVARILPPEERGATPWVRVYIDVDLRQQLAAGASALPLFDGDVVTVFGVPEDKREFVVVEGAVWNAGRLQWIEGMHLRDAIMQAGGLREEALMSRVEVIRTRPDETTVQISQPLARVMDGDPEVNILLVRRDRVVVSSIHDVFPRKRVTIYGQVQIPGEYLLHENMTVVDLIVRAGGLTKDAWTVSAEVVRMHQAADGGVTEFRQFQVPIDTSYTPQLTGAFQLQDFDQVFIRRKPKWEEKRNVILQGEVLFPGTFALIREGESVADLIERAGGFTPYAFPEGARFYRKFEDAGRINVNLRDALQRPDSGDNIVMQPGDSLYVPPRVEFVIVRGQVGYPSSILYVRGKTPRYYIDQAGGYAEGADRRHTRVTLPNGSTWQPRWFILPDPELQPGSEIFVPERMETDRNTWEVLRDTTAVLSSFTTVLLLIWQISR